MINGDHNNGFFSVFRFNGISILPKHETANVNLIRRQMLCNCNAMKLFKHSDESAQKEPKKSIMTTTGDYHLPDG